MKHDSFLVHSFVKYFGENLPVHTVVSPQVFLESDCYDLELPPSLALEIVQSFSAKDAIDFVSRISSSDAIAAIVQHETRSTVVLEAVRTGLLPPLFAFEVLEKLSLVSDPAAVMAQVYRNSEVYNAILDLYEKDPLKVAELSPLLVRGAAPDFLAVINQDLLNFLFPQIVEQVAKILANEPQRLSEVVEVLTDQNLLLCLEVLFQKRKTFWLGSEEGHKHLQVLAARVSRISDFESILGSFSFACSFSFAFGYLGFLLRELLPVWKAPHEQERIVATALSVLHEKALRKCSKNTRSMEALEHGVCLNCVSLRGFLELFDAVFENVDVLPLSSLPLLLVKLDATEFDAETLVSKVSPQLIQSIYEALPALPDKVSSSTVTRRLLLMLFAKSTSAKLRSSALETLKESLHDVSSGVLRLLSTSEVKILSRSFLFESSVENKPLHIDFVCKAVKAGHHEPFWEFAQSILDIDSSKISFFQRHDLVRNLVSEVMRASSDMREPVLKFLVEFARTYPASFAALVFVLPQSLRDRSLPVFAEFEQLAEQCVREHVSWYGYQGLLSYILSAVLDAALDPEGLVSHLCFEVQTLVLKTALERDSQPELLTLTECMLVHGMLPVFALDVALNAPAHRLSENSVTGEFLRFALIHKGAKEFSDPKNFDILFTLVSELDYNSSLTLRDVLRSSARLGS